MSTPEETHLSLFERLDFEGWNGPDWDLFRELHTDDVIVEMMGQRTEGIEAHLAVCQAYVASTPDSKIRSHPIQFGSAEWTSGVGQLAGGTKWSLLQSGETTKSARNTSSWEASRTRPNQLAAICAHREGAVRRPRSRRWQQPSRVAYMRGVVTVHAASRREEPER